VGQVSIAPTDVDDGTARARTAQEGLRSAAATLITLLSDEPQLRTFIKVADHDALEAELRLFLKGAFDGGDWPPLQIQRSLLESHLADLAAAICERLQSPLPLGEDPLIAALQRLRQRRPDGGRDPRVARFYEALVDLIFFAGDRKPTLRLKARPSVQLLEGSWRSSDGSSAVVRGGVCRLNGGAPEQLRLEQGSVVLQGWTADSTNGVSVKWTKPGATMEWIRKDSDISGTDLSDDAPKVPDGMWRDTSGLVCTVCDGVCTFVSNGVKVIKTENGATMMDGMKVTSATDSVVKWVMTNGSKVEWRRLESPEQVEPLVGTWRNGEGHIFTIAEGRCTVLHRGPFEWAVKKGLLNLNGWSLTGITEKTIYWRNGARRMEWQRIDSVFDLSFLNGAWEASDGQCVHVLAGKVSSASPPSTAHLSMQGGLVAMDGWRAVALRQQSIAWRQGSAALTWTRVGDGS